VQQSQLARSAVGGPLIAKAGGRAATSAAEQPGEDVALRAQGGRQVPLFTAAQCVGPTVPSSTGAKPTISFDMIGESGSVIWLVTSLCTASTL
jgi:hypothetical protein